MDLPKILLFYSFTPIVDPEAIRLWQETLCSSLGIKGRIIISPHGINATLGGPMSAMKRYVKQTKSYKGFKNVDFKWSEGTGTDFPRLSVKVRPELVAFGDPAIIKVSENGIENGGTHLTPEEVHQLVEERGDDVVFFDGRNSFEAKIGRFENAIVPNVTTSHDFIAEIESGKYDEIKHKPVVTYCTGGIRCEILSAVMKERGFTEVYQISGGIVRYGEKFGNDGLWKGSLYTFDGRMTMDFAPGADVIGECESCNSPSNTFINCPLASCHQLVLLCSSCAKSNSKSECHHALRVR